MKPVSSPQSVATDISAHQQPIRHGLMQWRVQVTFLLILCSLLTTCYVAVSLYIATELIKTPPHPIKDTPASMGLSFRNVTFPSRDDHIQIPGWLIPGVLPDGSLTVQRTIIMVHGSTGNRAYESLGLLELSSEFARRGFAVLSIDLRGHGEAPPAPLSLGYFEQRDVLGAVDFLRSGQLPYPQLGHPRSIFGWGVSMGGATLLFAAAREPALAAIVSDCTYADIIPILEREIPKQGHLLSVFTPGGLITARILYSMDFYTIRPVDIMAGIATRPIFLIHGSKDSYIPPSNMDRLATAARTAPGANVQTWMVPDAKHARSFLIQKKAYVDRVIGFYTKALGTDTKGA